MSFQKIRIFAVFLLSGSFFIVDRAFKLIAFQNPDASHYFIPHWIGWEYFENRGVAFGIPVPWYAAFIYMPIILFALWQFAKKKQWTGFFFSLGFSLLIFGAISNLFDRLYYHFTIDYIRVFTSIFNIADLMIVIGALLLLSKEFQKNKAPNIAS